MTQRWALITKLYGHPLLAVFDNELPAQGPSFYYTITLKLFEIMSSILGLGVNYEEAANMVSEFIYSIDNLPHEAAHILQEMKNKETRVQELQQEIDKDTARYIRHALRTPSSGSTSGQSTPGSAPPQPPPAREPSPKSAPLPGKIAAAYAEIHTLSNEKCALAQRIVDLVQRTQARLDTDLVKIRVLQGEPPEGLGPPITMPGLLGLGIGATGSAADALVASGRDPALKITESLRNVLAAGGAINAGIGGSTSASGASTPSSHANKKRKTGAATSIPLPPVLKLTPSSVAAVTAGSTKSTKARRSSSPSVTPSRSRAARNTGHGASRLSKQIIPEPDDVDMDAEGEEDAEGEIDGEGENFEEGDEGEDERLYCFCQKQSYGDMIGCDNDNCPYEWFHLNCVGMKQPLPDKWYCTVCISKGAGPVQPPKKGRKK
ncbi:hypothetical protein BDQ17DRAFT_1426419 [Cyathus striatus]|nr:hypothetical protein BDQ17DRAFT_1426419 [Cyathus striatus]